MSEISRREFFKKTAADAAVVGILASAGVKLYANPLGLPIGSQTYPHRQLIKDGNFADLLKTLKSDDERSKAAVYMEGLNELRKEWKGASKGGS